jgi:very-short-patch-repair endonuclease
MHLSAHYTVFNNARILREQSTEAEQKLWSYLRDKQLEGTKFRRQHPVTNYILDFYAHSFKLAIELDGIHHSEDYMQFQDMDREENLLINKITIIRFTNDEVLNSIDSVLERIRSTINGLKITRL